MSAVFTPEYASAYDTLYSDKDYAAECDLLERVFEIDGRRPVRRVLDLGCGTGSHSLPLAERGYEVVGVDRSEAMLGQARAKAASAGLDQRLNFRAGDVRSVDLGQAFDATLMMFAVLGYQETNRDVIDALRTVRRHLLVEGLFIFDVWYGPAVMAERPTQRLKVLGGPGGQVIRAASGELNSRRQLCTVHYDVWRLAGDRVLSNTRESHTMRYFFPLELELFLESSGLQLVRLSAFPELDREPDETTWNVLAVARAV